MTDIKKIKEINVSGNYIAGIIDNYTSDRKIVIINDQTNRDIFDKVFKNLSEEDFLIMTKEEASEKGINYKPCKIPTNSLPLPVNNTYSYKKSLTGKEKRRQERKDNRKSKF